MSGLYRNKLWRGRDHTEKPLILPPMERQVDLSQRNVILAGRNEDPFFASIFMP